MRLVLIAFWILSTPLIAFENAEVKLRLDPADLNKLPLKERQLEERTVYFLDDDELSLYQQGLVFRARIKPDDRSDSSVKVRPYDDLDSLPYWVDFDGFKVETDIIEGREADSASMKRRCKRGDILALEDQDCLVKSLDELYNSAQICLALNYAREPVDLMAMRVFGPIDSYVWKKRKKGIVIEFWPLEGAEDILEISTKVPYSEAEAAADRLETYVDKYEVRILEDAQSKTRSSLEAYR